MSTKTPRWPDVAGLIPHRPPILMVDEIVEGDEGELTCRGSLPCSNPFLALELAAQATAVMAALERREASGEQGAEPGYLAAIRDAEFLEPEIPSDTPLLVTVRNERSFPPLRKYAIRVVLEEGRVELIRAGLSTFQAAQAASAD